MKTRALLVMTILLVLNGCRVVDDSKSLLLRMATSTMFCLVAQEENSRGRQAPALAGDGGIRPVQRVRPTPEESSYQTCSAPAKVAQRTTVRG